MSNDDLELSQETQKLFPHLIVVADPDEKMIKAMQVMHEGAAPGGKDAAAPTTFLFQYGEVRWLFRPDRITDRLSPEQLAAAIDQHKSLTPSGSNGALILPDQ